MDVCWWRGWKTSYAASCIQVVLFSLWHTMSLRVMVGLTSGNLDDRTSFKLTSCNQLINSTATEHSTDWEALGRATSLSLVALMLNHWRSWWVWFDRLRGCSLNRPGRFGPVTCYRAELAWPIKRTAPKLDCWSFVRCCLSSWWDACLSFRWSWKHACKLLGFISICVVLGINYQQCASQCWGSCTIKTFFIDLQKQ